MDLFANIRDNVFIDPGKYNIIPTGLIIALPSGFEAQVRPRSGLAFKYGITVLNSPGTIDSDYRGEINIILINLGSSCFEIKRGDRVAQLVINKIEQVELTFAVSTELRVRHKLLNFPSLQLTIARLLEVSTRPGIEGLILSTPLGHIYTARIIIYCSSASITLAGTAIFSAKNAKSGSVSSNSFL